MSSCLLFLASVLTGRQKKIYFLKLFDVENNSWLHPSQLYKPRAQGSMTLLRYRLRCLSFVAVALHRKEPR